MINYKKLLLTLFITLIGVCYASSCHVAGGGALDNLLSEFTNAAYKWQGMIEQRAKLLFTILFTIEFLWQLTVNKVFAGDVEKLWVFFLTRVIFGAIFYKYIINISFYESIINYFINLGSSLSSFKISLSNKGVYQLSPSAVISSFSCMEDMVHQTTGSLGIISYSIMQVVLGIGMFLIFILFDLIAFILIKVVIQAYFLLYAGFLLTGFAGSSWTMRYWQRYLSAIAGVAIKFLVICLIMGVIYHQMGSWATEINQVGQSLNHNPLPILFTFLAKVLGTTIIMYFILQELPDWAANALAGEISFNTNVNSASNFMSGGTISSAKNYVTNQIKSQVSKTLSGDSRPDIEKQALASQMVKTHGAAATSKSSGRSLESFINQVKKQQTATNGFNKATNTKPAADLKWRGPKAND